MAGSSTLSQRREDFPIKTFQYLEKGLQVLRKEVMMVAAGIAEKEDDNPEAYTVQPKHVCLALSQLLGNPQRCKELVELN